MAPVFRLFSVTAVLAAAVAAGLLLAGPAAAAPGEAPGGRPRLDTDRDGTVSKAEREAFARGKARAIDANGDGVITADEILAHQAAAARKRAEGRLKRADANKDGKVTAQEYEAVLAAEIERRSGKRKP